MDELEKAHLDYEKRRNEIISKLETLANCDLPPTFIKWLEQTIEFIKEREV